MKKTPPFKYKEILKMPKTWIMGIAYGFIGMATVGLMSQLVPYLITRGFGQKQAIGTLTVAAIIGLFGSYFWGVIDQKLGTKKPVFTSDSLWTRNVYFNNTYNGHLIYWNISLRYGNRRKR
jgi:cyanate permease